MSRLPSFQGFAPDRHVRMPVQHLFDALIESVRDLAMRKAGSSGLFLQTSECCLDESEVGLPWRPAVLWLASVGLSLSPVLGLVFETLFCQSRTGRAVRGSAPVR